MTLTRAALMLAVLAATGTCWAGGKEQSSAAPKARTQETQLSPRGAAPASKPPAAAPQGNPADQPQQGGLVPRVPMKKLTIHKPSGDSRLFVKFRDDLKVRVGPEKALVSH